MKAFKQVLEESKIAKAKDLAWNTFSAFKQVLEESKIAKAKDLAWNTFSKKEQKVFLKQAKVIQNQELTDLAIKCVKEAEEAMSQPGYISRADPSVYEDNTGENT